MSIRNNIDTLLKKLEKEYRTHNCIEVSRSAILHNLDLFTNLNNMPAIPVLKGNAYGHSISLVAKALKGRRLPYIAVDGYFEALRVREVSSQPVLVMGAILPENYAKMKYDNFAFVVQDIASVDALGATGKRIAVHIEVNTGMNRYGAKPDETIELAKRIMSYKNLELEGIMSHLADSDGNDPATVDAAVSLFDSAVEAVRALGADPSMLHVAQSAGSIRAHSKYANMFRLGVGLYGINPFQPKHPLYKKLAGLQPALSLISTVTKVIDLQKGDKVSYNYTFQAPKAMKIGVLPLGYYEGVNRALSNVGTVSVTNRPARIVGRVCMNHTMIELDNKNVRVGDKVVVYSSNPNDINSVDSIASKHGLFNYNLLTSLNQDVRRILVD